MKKNYFRFLSLVVASLLISFTAISQNANTYYWDGPVKRMIDLDSSESIVNLSQNEFNDLQRSGRQMEVGRRDQNITVVIRNLSKQDRRQMKSRIGYLLSSRQNKSERSYVTDEISIKLKSRSSITYLENKYGIKLQEKLRMVLTSLRQQTGARHSISPIRSMKMKLPLLPGVIQIFYSSCSSIPIRFTQINTILITPVNWAVPRGLISTHLKHGTVRKDVEFV
ncbi:MAG: hypothetical protein WDO14_21700 [Bacteroidota bacterium]